MNLKQIPKVLDSKTSCLRIRVPENLDLALEGLIRKVLREQPKTDDIYSFAANYFETLLKIRDKVGTKLTATQLCSFHNDEDANEMIKIAGTFKKPQKTNAEFQEIQKKKEAETQQKKDVKRPSKSKQTVKGKKSVKRPTPDLIKKLPMTTKTQSEEVKEEKEAPENEKAEEVKPEITEEKAEVESEEFLTSDPIKELVEKELLMEGKSSGKDEETSADVSILETSETKTEPKNKQEEQKPEEEKNEFLIEETPIKEEEKENEVQKTEIEYQGINKEQEDAVKSTEKTMTNAEEAIKEEIAEKKKETPEETGKKEKSREAEVIKTPLEKIDKKEIKKDEVEDIKETKPNEKSLSEGENKVVETPKVETQIETLEDEKDKKEEEIKKGTEEEENEKTEIMNETEKAPEISKQNAKGDIIPSKTLLEGDMIPTAVVQETHIEPSKENEINEEEEEEEEIKATGGQKQETEIDKETKATDENTPKTAEETLPSGGNSFVANPTEDVNLTEIDNNEKMEKKETETEERRVENEEKITPNEIETKEILENQKTNSQNVSQSEDEGKVTEKVKETISDDSESKQTALKNEEILVTNIENKDKEEDVKENSKEEPKDRTEDAKLDETIKGDESTIKAESQTSLETKSTQEEITNQGEKPIEENQKSKTESPERTPDGVITTKEESEEEYQTEKNLENLNKKISQIKDEEPEKTQETPEVQEDKENTNQIMTEPLTKIQKIPTDDGRLNEEPKPSEKVKQTEEELCTVFDSQNIQRKDEIEIPSKKEIHLGVEENKEDEKTEPKELCGVVDVQNITDEKTENEIIKPEIKVPQSKKEEINPEELCTVVDVEHIPKEDATEKTSEIEITQNMTETEPPSIVEPENIQNPEVSAPSEVQIKTIQTHYYDTLQVPETVTKEYIVHDLSTPSITTLLGVADSLHQNYKQTQKPIEETVFNENINSPPPIERLENITISPPSETTMDVLQPEDHLKNIRTDADVQTQQETESSIQITDSDDLLDIMTPTSGYSLNLSDISWQTINGVFLDSERRYSSLEKEEIRYATPKSDDQNRQQVEEVIHKTVIPTGIEAVPVPPEEVNEEANIETVETEKDKKEEKGEGEGEPEGSSDSTNGKSSDGDIPFISVEVKTVIETQMVDEEDAEPKRRPGVEVKVEATIDIQDDVEMPQSEMDSTEERNKISNGSSQEIKDSKSSWEDEKSKSQSEEKKESCSTEQKTVGEGSSGDSDTTISSAATEIKRTESGKRNFSSTRSLLSTQSLDLGKRNPLVKTRSLSTFRHGVTDFEVWNTIEKELEEAATKIQSKFRGYKTRKKLQRENAVQITTEESSVNTTPVEAEAEAEAEEEEKEEEESKIKDEGQQSTGEFHDSIVLAEHPR